MASDLISYYKRSNKNHLRSKTGTIPLNVWRTTTPEDEERRSNKNEGLFISFIGAFFPTPPLLIPNFYDVRNFFEGLSSSSNPHMKTFSLL